MGEDITWMRNSLAKLNLINMYKHLLWDYEYVESNSMYMYSVS